MTVRPSTAWRRLRWVLGLVALCTLATCPAAIQRCRVEQTAEEAPALLRYLIAQVRAHVTAHGDLPQVSVGPTPAVGTCCARARACEADPARWIDPGWRALAFSIDGRHRFSYEARREGPAMVLRAIGDQDCDGVVATYEVHLTLEGGALVETWKRDRPLE